TTVVVGTKSIVQMPSSSGRSRTVSTPSAAATPLFAPLPAPNVASASAGVGHELDPFVTTYSSPSSGAHATPAGDSVLPSRPGGRPRPEVPGSVPISAASGSVPSPPSSDGSALGLSDAPASLDAVPDPGSDDPPTSDCAHPDRVSAAVTPRPSVATRTRVVPPDRCIRLIVMPRSFHSPLRTAGRRWHAPARPHPSCV